jgi:hypothetical protein
VVENAVTEKNGQTSSSGSPRKGAKGITHGGHVCYVGLITLTFQPRFSEEKNINVFVSDHVDNLNTFMSPANTGNRLGIVTTHGHVLGLWSGVNDNQVGCGALGLRIGSFSIQTATNAVWGSVVQVYKGICMIITVSGRRPAVILETIGGAGGKG